MLGSQQTFCLRSAAGCAASPLQGSSSDLRLRLRLRKRFDICSTFYFSVRKGGVYRDFWIFLNLIFPRVSYNELRVQIGFMQRAVTKGVVRRNFKDIKEVCYSHDGNFLRTYLHRLRVFVSNFFFFF